MKIKEENIQLLLDKLPEDSLAYKLVYEFKDKQNLEEIRSGLKSTIRRDYQEDRHDSNE